MERRRVITEALFAAALLGACAWLVLRPQTAFMSFPSGSDWETYLDNGIYLWGGESVDVTYQTWRKPLHGYLVGLLALGTGSIARAALALTAASCLGMVLGGGLLGRALGNAWTGAATALGVSWLGTFQPMSSWVNNYPLTAGLVAVATGAAAATVRWRSPGWALVATLSGSLAFATDTRGLPGLVVAVLAVLGAAVACRGAWRRLALLVALASVGTGVGVAVDTQMPTYFGVELDSIEDRVGQQSALRGMSRTALPDCMETAPREPACMAQVAQANHAALERSGALPAVALGLTLLVLLVPARWGKRSVWASVVVIGPSVGALGLGMGLVEYPERYAASALVPLVALLPLVAHRVADVASRWLPRPQALHGVAAALALVGLAWTWPGLPRQRAAVESAETSSQGRDDPRQRVADWALAELGPDDLVLDCGDASFLQLTAPLEVQQQRFAPQEKGRCTRLVKSPTQVAGDVYLLAGTPTGGRQSASPSQETLEAAGWTQVDLGLAPEPSYGTLQLWKAP